MEKNKLAAMAVIAVILGAVGLGFGAYSIINIQTGAVKGEDGDDGDDGAVGITTIVYKTENEYPCSSEADINNAINMIGTGNGKILITGSITLNSHIDIDGGGSYIIQGNGLPTIDCGGDRTAFNITNAKSCIIKDLIIDASDIVKLERSIIIINETNDNPVYIENLQILGNIGQNGKAIYVESDNIWIYNCYLSQFLIGIHLNGSSNLKIFDNTIYNCSTGIRLGDIGMWSMLGCENITIENNLIQKIGWSGIECIFSTHITIANNIIRNNFWGVELLTTNYSLISGNMFTGRTVNFGSNNTGIYLSGANYNTLNGNGIYDYHNLVGTTYGHGIVINPIATPGECVENTIIGNTALNNDYNFRDYGTNTFGNKTLNNFG